MKRAWAWWMSHLDREMDPRPLAAVRILVPLAVIFDILRLLQLGLFSHVFVPYSLGGLSRIQDPHWVLDAWLGTSASAIALGVTLLCLVLTAAGLWMRPAILIGVLAYAQLGHLFPPGDRAIDRLVRSGLLILMFSGADRVWSMRKAKTNIIPAWPADLIRYLLVLVYLSSGLSKLIQQPGWLSLTAEPPLLRILIDPMAADLNPVFWADYPWLFRLGGFVTIAFELAAPLLLTRHATKLAVVGLLMHLGVAYTMTLGMFSWGMLAFYPLFLAPLILPRLDAQAAERSPPVAPATPAH
jgi:hypothetical protein